MPAAPCGVIKIGNGSEEKLTTAAFLCSVSGDTERSNLNMSQLLTETLVATN